LLGGFLGAGKKIVVVIHGFGQTFKRNRCDEKPCRRITRLFWQIITLNAMMCQIVAEWMWKVF